MKFIFLVFLFSPLACSDKGVEVCSMADKDRAQVLLDQHAVALGAYEITVDEFCDL